MSNEYEAELDNFFGLDLFIVQGIAEISLDRLIRGIFAVCELEKVQLVVIGKTSEKNIKKASAGGCRIRSL
ncbi:hypothetical protein BSNK01_01930 [Bacillaceae bacterium]